MAKDKDTAVQDATGIAPAAAVAFEPSDSYRLLERDLADLKQQTEAKLSEFNGRLERLRTKYRGE